ncbi:MAG: branched-chain amino acid ABC transporter permease [Pseudomonadota bacterium]
MLKRIEQNPLLTLAVVAAGFLAYGHATSLFMMTDFIIFTIFVLGFDMAYGQMGKLSFGHMLYFGSGAYGAAMCSMYLSQDPFLAIGCGVLAGAVVGALLGPVLVRLKGAAFALANLAFNQLGYFVVLVPLAPWTGGEDGFSLDFATYGFINFAEPNFRFYFCLACLLCVVFLYQRFTRAPYGIFLRATKENETRVRFLGYDTHRFKVVTFVFSTTISALAGALNALNLHFTNPSLMDPTRSVEVIFAALMGGAGHVLGAVMGGAAFMTIRNYLADYLVRWEMFLGIALLFIAFRLRTGLRGILARK